MQKTAIKFSPVNIEKRAKLDIRSGDTIRVWSKIQEKGKTRLQAFEGLVLARKHGAEPGATITVRKVASGIGVERIFPLYSPLIDKIEIVKRAKTRRAKLYYIRDKATKEIRKKMKALTSFAAQTYKEEEEKQSVSDEGSSEDKEAVKEETQAEEATEEKTKEEPKEQPAEKEASVPVEPALEEEKPEEKKEDK